MENFEKDSNKFCLEEIESFDKEKIKKFVESFKSNEKIEDVLSERVREFIKEYEKDKGNKTIGHLNILLVGPSGVGKSTLINSILQLDEEKSAKEGNVEPCTMGEPEFYESLKVNFIRVADSRGIEKGNYGIEAVVESTKNFINQQLLTNDPDKYIHCIWYCITGARFEDIEKESLVTLSNIYDNNTMPIIVVYTKAIMKQLYEPIKEKINQLNKNLGFAPVISKEIEIEEEVSDEDEEENENKKKQKKLVEKKGLKNLIKMSCEKAQNAIKSSCYTGIKNNILNDVQCKNNKKNEKMTKYIQNENEYKINNFKEGMNYKEIAKNISEIIIKFINSYLYEDAKSLTKDSADEIEIFLNGFFRENLKYFKENFQNLLEEESKRIASKLFDCQKETMLKNNVNLVIQSSKEEYQLLVKNLISEKLKPKAELCCLKNCAFFISEPIRKSFSNFLMKLFEQTLNSEKIKDLLQSTASKMFDNLKLNMNQNKKSSNKK